MSEKRIITIRLGNGEVRMEVSEEAQGRYGEVCVPAVFLDTGGKHGAEGAA